MRVINIGDKVQVTFVAEVSDIQESGVGTVQYEVILPYPFMSGRYNHAYFGSDEVELFKEPYEDGAVYRTASGAYAQKEYGEDIFYLFGEEDEYTEDELSLPLTKVVDAEGKPV